MLVGVGLGGWVFASQGSVTCSGSLSAKYQCWNSAVSELLVEDKIPQALQQLQIFSKQSPDFIQMCHAFAHQVGERAYTSFKAGERLSFTPDMQVCDFGFFHGFVTEFLFESGNRKEVGKEIGEFCTTMQGDDSNGQKSYSRAACFHGVGHGSVIHHDVREWSDPVAIVQQTLSLCRQAAETDEDFVKCAGGAYNGISYDENYAKKIDKQDPFKICRELGADGVPEECYANLASVVFNLTPDKTLQEAIDLAYRYTPSKYLQRTISTFAAMFARQLNTAAQAVPACLGLAPDLQEYCLGSYVSGLVQAGTPDDKQKGAYAFCSSKVLPDEWHTHCFEAAFQQLADFWSKEKIQTSCVLAPLATQSCEAAWAVWSSL